jgi:prepilin peptidase CpaA
MPAEVLLAAAELFLKAAAILVLVRIAITDFRQHKIYNSELLSLLALALTIVLTEATRLQSTTPALIAGAASAAIFLALIVFWVLRKVGAGDVKLLTIVPLLVGYTGALPMMLMLLALTLFTYLVMKFPVLVPERWFRIYAQSLDSTGRVPFGVPIAAATIFALLLPGAG